jgi:hypothetical protein
MWGTSSPDDKLTGDLGNVIEITQVGGSRSDRLTARKSSPGNLDFCNTIGTELPIPNVRSSVANGGKADKICSMRAF